MQGKKKMSSKERVRIVRYKKDEVIRYYNNNSYDIPKTAKKFGVSYGTMLRMLKEWEVYVKAISNIRMTKETYNNLQRISEYLDNFENKECSVEEFKKILNTTNINIKKIIIKEATS